MTLNKNSKSFNLTNRISKSFNVIIDNFAFAATLITKIFIRVRISFVAQILLKISSVIRLRRVRLLISQVKLITKITQIINLRRVRIIATMRQTMRFVSIVYLRNPILFVSKARQKIVSLIRAGKLVISATPVVATFFSLGTYDPQTLGTLDTKTLGEMDYTVV